MRLAELICRESRFECLQFAGNWGIDGRWEKAAERVHEHGAALSTLTRREIHGQEARTALLLAA